MAYSAEEIDKMRSIVSSIEHIRCAYGARERPRATVDPLDVERKLLTYISCGVTLLEMQALQTKVAKDASEHNYA